jgi:3-oxoacyl-[acyl-carrier protein] reductase
MQQLCRPIKRKMEFCVVITGAGKGIGMALVKEIIHRFQKEDLVLFPNSNLGKRRKIRAVKIIAISRQTKDLLKLRQKVEKKETLKGVTLIPIAGELGNREGLEEVISRVKAMAGPVHALINNAGSFLHAPLKEISLEKIMDVYFVNVVSPTMLIKGLMPQLEMEESHILNIGSMGGIQGSLKFPGFSVYSSSKMALAGITECLAVEMPCNVSINCLALGSVNTEMLKTAFPDYVSDVEPEQMGRYIFDYMNGAPGLQNGKLVEISRNNP